MPWLWDFYVSECCETFMSLNVDSGVLWCSKRVQTKDSRKRERPKWCRKTVSQNIGMWLQKHILTHRQISWFTAYWFLLKPQRQDFLCNDIVTAAKTRARRCSYLRVMCHYRVSQKNKKLGSVVKPSKLTKLKLGTVNITAKVKHFFSIPNQCTFMFNTYFDFYHICPTCFSVLNTQSSGIILYYLHKTICFLQ